MSINLEHIGYPNESLAVAEDGLQDLWVRAGSRVAMQRRVLRLGKPPRRWKIPSFSASIKRKITEVQVWLIQLGVLLFVYSCLILKSTGNKDV